MEQAPRVRGCSSLGSQKRGSPGRLTADASLLATPSARLTVVERTPSCPCHVQKRGLGLKSGPPPGRAHSHRSLHRPSRGPFFVKVASEHPLPPSPPAPCFSHTGQQTKSVAAEPRYRGGGARFRCALEVFFAHGIESHSITKHKCHNYQPFLSIIPKPLGMVLKETAWKS